MKFRYITTTSWILRGSLIGILLFAAYHVKDFQQDSDITRFLPEGESQDQIVISRLLGKTLLNRSLLIRIQSGTGLLEDAAAFSDEFTTALQSTHLFDSVTNRADTSQGSASLYQAYFPSRFSMVSGNPETEIGTMLSDEGLNRRTAELKAKLLSPMSSAIKHLVTADPLMLFLHRMDRIQSAARSIQPATIHQRFATWDRSGFLIVAATRADPFDTAIQRTVVQSMETIFQELNVKWNQQFTMDYTGISRFAMDGERLIKTDIQRAFIISLAGIILIFLLFYRGLRLLPVMLAPVGAGMIVALGLSTLIFGKLSGITLAFGSSLIGICIDYPVHLINHMRRFGVRQETRRVFPVEPHLFRSLFVSAFTTLAGFAVIAGSSFPGIRQIAVFSSIGISYAFLFSTLFLPLWYRSVRTTHTVGIDPFERIAALVRRFRLPILLAGIILVTCAAGRIPGLTIYTDLQSLNSTDPETVAADTEIRRQLPTSRFDEIVVIRAGDLQTALEKNEQLYQEMVELTEDTRLAGFFSVHPFLFSDRLQARNLAVFKANGDWLPRFAGVLQRQGFSADSILPALKQGLVDPPNLSYAALADTPLKQMLDNFIFFSDTNDVYILNLVAPGSQEDFERLHAADTSRMRIHQTDILNQLVTTSQSETTRLVIWGLVLISAILLIYHRRVRAALSSLLPAVIAAVLVVGILTLTTESMNMMHLMALVLILSMGVDYGIFMTDSLRPGRSGAEMPTAARSITISAISTFFTFGVLIFVRNPALESIGVAAGAGIVLALLSAFIIGVTVQGRPRHDS